MSAPGDRRAAYRAALVDEALSTIRHDVRNRLGAIRNATFYVARRVKATPLATTDARVVPFLELIDREVATCDGLLGGRFGGRRAVAEETSLRAELEAAVQSAGGAPEIDGDARIVVRRDHLETLLDAVVDLAPTAHFRVFGAENGHAVVETGPVTVADDDSAAVVLKRYAALCGATVTHDAAALRLTFAPPSAP